MEFEKRGDIYVVRCIWSLKGEGISRYVVCCICVYGECVEEVEVKWSVKGKNRV